jgi:hypothetical protein
LGDIRSTGKLVDDERMKAAIEGAKASFRASA